MTLNILQKSTRSETLESSAAIAKSNQEQLDQLYSKVELLDIVYKQKQQIKENRERVQLLTKENTYLRETVEKLSNVQQQAES